MSKPFRYGLFGVGRIGRVHGKILQSQGQRIVAVGDEKPEATALAVRELSLDGVPTFTSSEAMVAAGGFDAAVISSHTKDHARDAAPFVRAGIPIYLEKPLTAELAEAFEFVRTIGDDRHVLQIGLQRRYDEALTYAKDLLDQKLIGDIREITCILRDQWPPPPTYVSPGLIIDMGIHVADEAIWLTGEFPNEVWARGFRAKGYGSPIDEGGNTAFVGFLTPSGIIGRLDLSRTHASGYNNETYVIGTKGTLHVGRFNGYPGPIPVELWNEQGALHCSKTFEMAYDLPPDRAEFQPRFHFAYARAHEAFREAVENEQPFGVSQNETLDAQVFAEAAYRSTQNNGESIRLERPRDVNAFEEVCRERRLL